MLYFVKTPKILKRLFANLTWDVSTNEKEIYLTFDDGPTPEITKWVLDRLSEYNAKATFFCIGKNVAKHPEIAQNIIAHGHSIGNHTQNHTNCWKVSKSTYLNDVEEAQEIINSKVLNQESINLFRPPYGKITSKRAKQLHKRGYKIIMWDVLSADFDQRINPEKCLQNVLKNTQKGSIVVFHDSIKAQKNLTYTLPKVLEHFSKKGYSFKAI
ncbi:polysaccharide deacetylase family protein [Pseudofulvibacter geojedonensis]|uniref:polysaccharide deacetylase family protein n=1 Tax=Pseudofulvibacter geojedonensis TaxID=1123758 RepID=UPI00366F5329